MRLELSRGASRRFWEAVQQGRTITFTAGLLGTKGQKTVRTYATSLQARGVLERLANSKRAQGYRAAALPVTPVAVGEREPRLEVAMLESSDDAAALVYADWLQAHGNSWGELISVQRARDESPRDTALRRRETALLKRLQLPHRDFASLTWRHGLITAAHFFNARDWMDDEIDVVAMARAVFELPMCGALRELRTGVMQWEHNTREVPALLEAASQHSFAQRLERLHLGDIPQTVDMDHHAIGDVRKLSQWFPRLRFLKLHSGGMSWAGTKNFTFGPLRLPHLETLIIETCALSSSRLAAVVESELPRLAHLELWFGSPDYGASAKPNALAPVLLGQFSRLKHLGLRNAECSDALCAQLVESPLARRLESLDFSLGTLGSIGVQCLLKGSKLLKNLRRLDVSATYLTPEEVRELSRAFAQTVVVAADLKGDDNTRRYCSVYE